MKILIVGLNYSPEIVGIAVYTSGLAEALVRRGHEVRVIAGKPYYPTWEVEPAFRGRWLRKATESGVDITRVAHYVPRKPSGGRRIAHHISFALSSFLPTLVSARRFRPDVVFTVAPSLIAAPVAALAAKLAGGKAWLHIQDFEVEAALATGLVSGGFWARLAAGFEARVLSAFDRVSSISPQMCRKCVAKGVAAERVYELRNWADIEGGPATEPGYVSSFRSEWQISTPHVALYSGNIANKQGIDIVVAAARRLRHRADLTFVVCGQGPNRANLEAQASDLTNIVFRDLQPKARLADLLSLASVHLLPQMAGAADLVLPSKLTNMLGSGRPVVATALPGTGLAQEVTGCGLVVPPDDEAAFADAILRLIDEPELSAQLGNAAKARAEEVWNREQIIARLERQMAHLVAS